MSEASSSASPWRRVESAVLWAAIVVAPLAILALVLTLAVNVPFEDDWDMLAVVTRWHAGTVTFADFWQQHSEHRIAALKGMIWAVGAATDFDVVAAMRVGFVLSALKLALLVDLIRRSLKGHAPRLIAPLALVSSLLMFSLVQHEDWFWGTASLQFSLLNLTTVTLVWALSRAPGSWWSLAAAVVCAVVAIFTEASGQALWITGAVAIWLFARERGRVAPLLAAWIVAAVSVSLIYWWHLRWAPSSSAIALLASPARFVGYTGALLGLPFAFWMSVGWAAVVGYAGVIPLVLGPWWLARSHRERLKTLFPFLLFGIHGVLVCTLIALGRSAGDPESALTSHYSFAPNLYWVSVLAVAAVGGATWASTSTPRRRRIGFAVAGATAGILIACYLKANIEGYQRAYARSRNLQMALATLSSPTEIPRPVLRFLYPPDEERARRLVAEMRALNLGPFTHASIANAPSLAARFAVTPAGPDADGFLDGGDCRGATGWAWDPAHPDSPVTVEVWSGDTLLGTVTADWFRWDLYAAGKGNGQHAFRFLFPTQSALSTGRVVTVRFSGMDRQLRGSPKTAYCRD